MSHSQFVSKCTVDTLQVAARKLLDGNLVAFPTETVYGLGADASNEKAVERVYETKARPVDHPLIVHVHSMQVMGEWAEAIPEYAIALARNFWPGPMTLIFKRAFLAKDFITGGQETVGIRVPGHIAALALLEAFHNLGGKGIAAPSANRFGHVSPTTAEAVSQELNQYLKSGDLILDGGPCTVGVESTIIDCTDVAPRILRPGAISEQMIEQSTGLHVLLEVSKDVIRVSGNLESHYAPAAKVLLCQTASPGQGLIAQENIETPDGVIRLASPRNDEEFARILYTALRSADEKGLSEVVVVQPIGSGIAVAIRDRLSRAAKYLPPR